MSVPKRFDELGNICSSGTVLKFEKRKPHEFDAAAELLKSIKVKEIFYVPGEHDELDDGQEFLKRYGKGTIGTGWHSHDHKGVHFIGLVNVAKLTSTGLGSLGQQQLDWLKKDVERLGPNTP